MVWKYLLTYVARSGGGQQMPVGNMLMQISYTQCLFLLGLFENKLVILAKRSRRVDKMN